MYKNVRHQHNRFSFRLSVLGKYVDAGESYDDEQQAGCAADLAKFHLRNTFKLHLEDSLGGDGEHFSRLSHRRNVLLSDCQSVEKNLAPGVKAFIESNRAALEAHRDSLPPEPDYVKVRRHAPSMEDPATRDWVRASEQAARDEKDFSEINHEYFNALLVASSKRLTDAIPPLRRAVKMLAGATNAKLISRRIDIESLIAHFETDRAWIEEFSAGLKSQQNDVASALKTLESNRPTLT